MRAPNEARQCIERLTTEAVADRVLALQPADTDSFLAPELFEPVEALREYGDPADIAAQRNMISTGGYAAWTLETIVSGDDEPASIVTNYVDSFDGTNMDQEAERQTAIAGLQVISDLKRTGQAEVADQIRQTMIALDQPYRPSRLQMLFYR